jgi:hypothetical protein
MGERTLSPIRSTRAPLGCRTVARKGKKMKRVYVAGLYSRNQDGSVANVIDVLRNMRAGQSASLEVMRMGFAVFCPWLDFQFGLLSDTPIPKEVYQGNSMAWLEVSDAVLVISGEGIGHGVDAEIKRARELNIPIFRSLKEFAAAQHQLHRTLETAPVS